MLVELKNGDTYNGHLVNCDNWMNINLRDVICTSRVRISVLSSYSSLKFLHKINRMEIVSGELLHVISEVIPLNICVFQMRSLIWFPRRTKGDMEEEVEDEEEEDVVGVVDEVADVEEEEGEEDVDVEEVVRNFFFFYIHCLLKHVL